MSLRARVAAPVRRRGLAVGLLCVGFGLAGLLWVAPAQWLGAVIGGVSEQQLTCRRWSGSVWRGRCEQMLLANGELGAVAWRLRGAAVLPVRIKVDLGWRRADSWLQGQLVITDFSAEVPTFTFYGLRGNLAFPTVRSLLPPNARQTLGLAANAEGMLWVHVPTFAFGALSPPCATGELWLDALHLPAWPSKLGPVQITLSDACPIMRGTIKDLGGPLQLDLQFDVDQAGMLALQGEISPRPISVAAWRDLLALMGPMTANGGYGVDLSMEWQVSN